MRPICTALVGHPCDPANDCRTPEPLTTSVDGKGIPGDHDREFCVDRTQLGALLSTTQSEVAEALALNENCPVRRNFVARLKGQVSERGTIDVLRHGVRYVPLRLDLFHRKPSAGNPESHELFERNHCTVTRQPR